MAVVNARFVTDPIGSPSNKTGPSKNPGTNNPKSKAIIIPVIRI